VVKRAISKYREGGDIMCNWSLDVASLNIESLENKIDVFMKVRHKDSTIDIQYFQQQIRGRYVIKVLWKIRNNNFLQC
jgi:hypothetical protein